MRRNEKCRKSSQIVALPPLAGSKTGVIFGLSHWERGTVARFLDCSADGGEAPDGEDVLAPLRTGNRGQEACRHR